MKAPYLFQNCMKAALDFSSLESNLTLSMINIMDVKVISLIPSSSLLLPVYYKT